MAARAAVRWAKVVLSAACLAPLTFLGWRLAHGTLRPDPVEWLSHTTGLSALILILVTLGITPVRRLTGIHDLIRFRRMLGLWAFAYAVIHFLIYVVFDNSLSLPSIAEDIVERPYVTVGFAALVLLVPLAVTSTTGWIRRLGGRRWSRLHQTIYLVAALGVLHFLWLVKLDTREPVLYATLLVVLLVARLGPAGRRRTRRTRGRPRRPPRSAARGVGGDIVPAISEE